MSQQETPDQKAARLEAERVERNREHLEGARAFAAAPQFGPAPVDTYTGPRQMPDHRPLVWSNAPYSPSPSLDERVITSIENFDENDPALAQARNAFSDATETLKKIASARDPLSKDTSKTLEMKLLAMAPITEKAQERVSKKFDNALKALTSLAQSVDEGLNKPLEQTTHSALCVEIRSYVRNLPQDRREAFVNDAVSRGDMQVMQSVLGAPAYLSEVSEIRKAMWLRQYRERANPIDVMRLAIYRSAIELVQDRGPLLHGEFERALGGSWKDVNRLRNQVSASDAALAALRGA
jgi:hypothetical protein